MREHRGTQKSEPRPFSRVLLLVGLLLALISLSNVFLPPPSTSVPPPHATAVPILELDPQPAISPPPLPDPPTPGATSSPPLTLTPTQVSGEDPPLATREELTQAEPLLTPTPAWTDPEVGQVFWPTGLVGRVRDQQGYTVARARVRVGDQEVRTDEHGRFFLEHVPAGTRLRVWVPGYFVGDWPLDALGTDPVPAQTSLHRGEARLVLPCPAGRCVDVRLSPLKVRGLYIPMGILRAPKRFWALMDLVTTSRVLNAVVIDVKGDYGRIAWESRVPLVAELKNQLEPKVDLRKALAEAHRRGIYTIARFVVFKDDPLATHKPEWGVRREDGTIWKDGEDLAWANPFREEVWQYNLALLEEVAQLGFDEIQLDYLRFPSDGDISAIVYEEENTRETRTAAIRGFMEQFHQRLAPYPVYTSADVFGLTVWVVPGEDMNIGQRVEDIAPYVDYLSPMVYPATFIPGNLGYEAPHKKPYEVIYRSVKQAQARVPPGTRVRPWLQAYWYTLPEMQIQRLAAEEAGSDGWLFWNAGGTYNKELFSTLPERETLWQAVYGSEEGSSQ